MLSPLKGGSGLKAKRKKSLFQSLGALATSPPQIKKNDRCFLGISGYESIPGMIPKSNARKCYLKDNASFF